MKYYLSRPFLPAFLFRNFLIRYHYDISQISLLFSVFHRAYCQYGVGDYCE